MITINGVDYIPASEVGAMAEKTDGMVYCIIRTYSAGVHAGFVKRREGKEVELVNSRRIWYWDGAASLSELATKGAGKPQNCKFPAPVPSITLTEAIEIIPCSAAAQNMIQECAVWTKN